MVFHRLCFITLLFFFVFFFFFKQKTAYDLRISDWIRRVLFRSARRDLVLAPSCSLLHVPVDLALETRLDGEVTQWLAFAVQKIEELVLLKRALNEGRASVADDLAAAARAVAARKTSPRKIGRAHV